jgi:Zn-dependent protease with chaperone function
MKYPALFALAFTAIFCSAQQNLKENYVPLKSSGELPSVFTQNIRNVIEQDLKELEEKKENDRSIKSSFVTASNYQIERIIRSGNVLINDEVTNYLNEIATVILKDNPELRRQVSIFTLKSSVVNAYAFDKGYIFVDIGLIAQAETEAQLAYILCHEISHYVKKHHINGYVKGTKLDRTGGNGTGYEDKLVEKCQYSKEMESEADLEGYKLYQKTAYSPKQAAKAFDMLQYAHLPFELIEFKKSFFESTDYVIPKGYLLAEVSPISDNSNADDSRSTHPNTARRKQTIAEIVKNESAAKVNAVVGKEKFEYIRDVARMELCRLYLKNRDYANALYAAYILQNKYPSNQYVTEVICKCLYAVALYDKGDLRYNNGSHLADGIPASTDIEGFPQQIYYFINKMPGNEWTIMALNYVYRAHKKFPANKSMELYSNELLKLMARVDWGIADFTRTRRSAGADSLTVKDTTEKEPVSKTDFIAKTQRKVHDKVDDSVYYKNVFADLFMTDTAFTRRFPITGSAVKEERRTEEQKNNKNELAGTSINRVLFLEPFYLKIDETRREQLQYVASDTKQEFFVNTVNECARMQDFELITIDPGLMTSKEVEKINDYSVINDWLAEKLDSDQEKSHIFNTNEIENLIARYGTQYVLKTGLVNYKNDSRKTNTYFYAFLFDIKHNQIVYKKYQRFKGRDKTDLVNAKAYQLLYELKNPKPKK